MTDHETLEACTLSECPPGLFMFNGIMGFKSEYTTTLDNPRRYQCDAYVVESGEYFWGGAKNTQERAALIVTPLRTGKLIPAPSVDDAMVERVARSLAPFMEGGREYDQMPATRRELKIWSRNGMALINDATQDDAQEAAIAAISAMQVKP